MVNDNDQVGDPLYEELKGWLHNRRGIRVLELGTKRSNPDIPTIRRVSAPHAEYIGSDFQDGLDVDLVADAHKLTDVTGENAFDAVLACSVFEHLQRPWIAAKEIVKALKPGGIAYVQTHFAFPVHGYPSDYFKFTREALHTIFDDAGLNGIRTTYAFPAQLIASGHIQTSPVHLNSNLIGFKP